MTFNLWLLAAANLAIVAGYLVLSLIMAPRLDVRWARTKIGGAGFFALCAMTHLDGAIHALAVGGLVQEPSNRAHLITHLIIHVPQAFFVWLFIDGLWREYLSQKTAHAMWREARGRRAGDPERRISPTGTDL